MKRNCYTERTFMTSKNRGLFFMLKNKEISLNGVVLPESVAIFTPQAVEEYGHINTSVTITVPSCCCVSVSGVYTDGTVDDAAVTPTPSILVRREASLSVIRVA